MLSKLKKALQKTRSKLRGKLHDLFLGKLDVKKKEALEELFFEADLGSRLSLELSEHIEPFLRTGAEEEKVYAKIESFLIEKLGSNPSIEIKEHPTIIFVVGINGSGKTTTTAKLANLYKKQGKSVLLVAADTFRAAAQQQLNILADQIGCPIVQGSANKDPSSVIFDGIQSGMAKKVDIILVDTAGRLHTKSDLMQELSKMVRVAKKQIASAPHQTLLVVDATIGQNAIDQALIFKDHVPLTGLIVTKLDGSAKGGICISIKESTHCPILYIGTGETIDDLEPFDAKTFVSALLESE